MIVKYLFQILRAEGIKLDSPNQLDVITERAEGDFRRIFQALQMFCSRANFQPTDFLQFE